MVHSLIMSISLGDLLPKPFRFQELFESSIGRGTGLESILLFEAAEYISDFWHILKLKYVVSISLAIAKLTDATLGG